MLRTNPIFAGLSEARRQELLDAAPARRIARGALILRDGEKAHSVFALESGRVRVFHTAPSGAEIVVKVFYAPALFGEAEALSGVAYVESADALSACELVCIPAPAFHALLEDEPSVARALCVDLAARLAISSYNEKSIAFNPATVRLANYLVDYASWAADDSGALKLELTQEDMAQAIGVTRRSIAKDIRDWQRERILERSERGYRVVDLPALRRFADTRRLALHHSVQPGFFKLRER